MSYAVLKALHLFGAFAWMAAAWYVPRILIYQRQIVDAEGTDSDKLNILHTMAQRLVCYILMPAMTATLVIGTAMVVSLDGIYLGFLHIKLLLVLLLSVYSVLIAKLVRQCRSGIYRFSSKALRWLNEIPTLILIAILIAVVIYH